MNTTSRINCKCLNCGKDFTKDRSQVKPNRGDFCCKSCSATYTNKTRPKRKPQGSCKKCGSVIKKCRTYCDDCVLSRFHVEESILLTLGEYKSRYDKKDCNLYSLIRYHARRITSNRLQICEKCGYDKHVHCCHIKAIADYSDDTIVGDINKEENLILLCPNCHWELDNL